MIFFAMTVQKYMKLEIEIFPDYKAKKNQTNSFVWFSGESTAQQSVYGFILPLKSIHFVNSVQNLSFQTDS